MDLDTWLITSFYKFPEIENRNPLQISNAEHLL